METSLELLNLGQGSLGVVWVRQFLGNVESGEQAEPCPGSVLMPAALGQGSACSPDSKIPRNCLTDTTPSLHKQAQKTGGEIGRRRRPISPTLRPPQEFRGGVGGAKPPAPRSFHNYLNVFSIFSCIFINFHWYSQGLSCIFMHFHVCSRIFCNFYAYVRIFSQYFHVFLYIYFLIFS